MNIPVTYHLYVDKKTLQPVKVWNERKPVYNQSHQWNTYTWNPHINKWDRLEKKMSGVELDKLLYVGKFCL